jgi:hypothetical protein
MERRLDGFGNISPFAYARFEASWVQEIMVRDDPSTYVK